MKKQLIKTALITTASVSIFVAGLFIIIASRAIPQKWDSEATAVVISMLLLTIIGCVTGIVIGGGIYYGLSRTNGPRWAAVLLSIIVSGVAAIIVGAKLGHLLVCMHANHLLHLPVCSGDDCCYAMFGDLWAGATGMLFGGGFGQRKFESRISRKIED